MWIPHPQQNSTLSPHPAFVSGGRGRWVMAEAGSSAIFPLLYPLTWERKKEIYIKITFRTVSERKKKKLTTAGRLCLDVCGLEESIPNSRGNHECNLCLSHRFESYGTDLPMSQARALWKSEFGIREEHARVLCCEDASSALVFPWQSLQSPRWWLRLGTHYTLLPQESSSVLHKDMSHPLLLQNLRAERGLMIVWQMWNMRSSEVQGCTQGHKAVSNSVRTRTQVLPIFQPINFAHVFDGSVHKPLQSTRKTSSEPSHRHVS